MSDLFKLTGKNVIVTGAAGSIGTQIAILFAQTGANLLLSDISETALDRLRSALGLHEPFPGRIMYATCDVAREEDVMSLVQILDQYGGVDVMVNNAGVFPHEDGDAVAVAQEAWDLTYNVNVKGTWHGCKHAVLSMRRNGKSKGSVINTSSVAGLTGSATAQLAYTSSKGAIIAMTRELGIVHARDGIRFNALCPGPLNTPLMQDYLGTDVDRRSRREIHLPQGRFGEPIEQAAAALFLASDASSFYNAQELVVDGGLTKAYVTPEGPAHRGMDNFAVE
ncbi:2,5-dichloro-2,5-cyclohexadiene-1,4-diol dehydrogenase [Colletotrichum orbiculare MAFF 240422]|uniref:2,5-dichloro-2,5-cyclohexadiene-1,4-diol dehydrogenase n=1 Tax=Colletotrichum orbiculare (strain 104-T / ATCC 96160 / CBS 514.97 / LARS 414 / MAFF 240422) TaxID=1213857 RepID=A0A484FT52_COLOR|nr:2,5-dichloro-2,5-cyclohexadiene-1,4-diol dehydrogenase [Colletotrichum orbiculare MAFF 240422]